MHILLYLLIRSSHNIVLVLMVLLQFKYVIVNYM